MMNSDTVSRLSTKLAKRVLDEASETDARITLAYEHTLSREPTSAERERMRSFLAESNTPESWAQLAQVLYASAEFRYLE